MQSGGGARTGIENRWFTPTKVLCLLICFIQCTRKYDCKYNRTATFYYMSVWNTSFWLVSGRCQQLGFQQLSSGGLKIPLIFFIGELIFNDKCIQLKTDLLCATRLLICFFWRQQATLYCIPLFSLSCYTVKFLVTTTLHMILQRNLHQSEIGSKKN